MPVYPKSCAWPRSAHGNSTACLSSCPPWMMRSRVALAARAFISARFCCIDSVPHRTGGGIVGRGGTRGRKCSMSKFFFSSASRFIEGTRCFARWFIAMVGRGTLTLLAQY